VFPSRSFRDPLGEIRSDQLEPGLELGLVNKRGVTSRGIYDGGEQEWDLAEDTRKQTEAASPWPRTRRLLRDLSGQYKRVARGEDEEAERLRRGMTDQLSLSLLPPGWALAVYRICREADVA
jgi:hypothetical protein